MQSSLFFFYFCNRYKDKEITISTQHEKNSNFLLLALMCVAFLPSKADEGMWLLQLMQEQHLADRMKAQGLLLEADDIYNPNRVSLKDAVGIFGGGCTGEIISPDGLILTKPPLWLRSDTAT